MSYGKESGSYSGYLVLNCDLGESDRVLKRIMSYEKVPGIVEIGVEKTFKIYDIVARISADDKEVFNDIVSDIKGIKSVRTSIELLDRSCL